MHDDGHEPELGAVRGAAQEEVQEVPRHGRAGGRHGDVPHQQPGQRVRAQPRRRGQERKQVTQELECSQSSEYYLFIYLFNDNYK